ncbi:hypothetical protein D3C72_2045420 [compost metagenome]
MSDLVQEDRSTFFVTHQLGVNQPFVDKYLVFDFREDPADLTVLEINPTFNDVATF